MKFSPCRTIASALILAISLVPARANDSSAAMAAGGLELAKNDQVRMVSEVLRIAPRLVEVDYVFQNTGTADVTTLVAFPLPELSLQAREFTPLNIPLERDKNFIGFQVWIDGREVKPDIEIRAFGKTGEITAELRRLGVDPLFPKLEDAGAIETLHRLNVVEGEAKDVTWTTRVNLHWSQTFPAGKRVAVHHRYRPVYGNFYTQFSPTDQRERITKKDQKLGGQWCFDQSYKDAELKLFNRQYEAAAQHKDYLYVWYDFVQYVLKTGANWNGPIGRFELQIDKGGAELVSTCPVPGLHLQRAPYGFNAVASNYTPTSDLDILFVSPRSLGRADGSPDNETTQTKKRR